MTLYIRQKPYASTFFGARWPGQRMDKLPRYKFMYYVSFKLSDDALSWVGENLKNLDSWQSGVSFKVHSIDKPSVDLPSTTLSQYNRKRNVYSKVEYHPFNIKMYDTVDDLPLMLWKKYFTYYFGDSRLGPDATGNDMKNDTMDVSQSVVDNSIIKPNLWGLNPVKENTYFFDKVELYAIFGKNYTQINYIKPKISKIDWQQYDSTSSELAEVSMTLEYEALEYLDSGSVSPELQERFGFNIEAPLEPKDQYYPDAGASKLSAPKPDTQNMIKSLLASKVPTNPTDLSASISNQFQVANSTLNIFNGNGLDSISSMSGTVIGQTTAPLNSYLTSFGSSTNAANLSQFIGTGSSGIPASPGVLGTFGNFDFGGTTNG
jgi:hypothetical protein